MTSVEQTIEIRAPIERVFDALTDPRRGPEWNPNIVEVTDFSGYPVHEGTTWRQVVMMLGRPMRLTCRVAEFQPPYAGVVEISGDQRGRIWTRCAERGAATHVVQGMEFVPPGGALGRLGAGMMRGRIQQELHGTMVRQRDALMAEGGDDGSRTDR